MVRSLCLLTLALPAAAADGDAQPYLPAVHAFPVAKQSVVGVHGVLAEEAALPAYVEAILPDTSLEVSEERAISGTLEVNAARRWMHVLPAQWMVGDDRVVTGMVLIETGRDALPFCVIQVRAARARDQVSVRMELDPSCPE